MTVSHQLQELIAQLDEEIAMREELVADGTVVPLVTHELLDGIALEVKYFHNENFYSYHYYGFRGPRLDQFLGKLEVSTFRGKVDIQASWGSGSALSSEDADLALNVIDQALGRLQHRLAETEVALGFFKAED